MELSGIPNNSGILGMGSDSANLLPIREFREVVLILGIPTNSAIRGIGSDSGIRNYNHMPAPTLMHFDMLEGYSI